MKKPKPEPGGIKTTVSIPPKLWTLAKTRAATERTSLKALLLEGLELRLAKKGGAE